MKYTLYQIKEALRKKEYIFFDLNKEYNVNIIGVRENSQLTNSFDDLLYLIYSDGEADNIEEFSITTDPGKYWLNNPINNDGCAIVVPGQYRGVWKIGYHQGKYQALIQDKPIKVYRDDNKDDVYDFEPSKIREGYYGINLHRSNPYTESYYVDKWSAGCQVFKRVTDFNFLLSICKISAKIYGNSFTYTLLEKDDF